MYISKIISRLKCLSATSRKCEREHARVHIRTRTQREEDAPAILLIQMYWKTNIYPLKMGNLLARRDVGKARSRGFNVTIIGCRINQNRMWFVRVGMIAVRVF